MLIKNRKAFNIGIVMAVLFVVVLILIFTPVFNGVTGLEFADDNFNKLAKGSAYYVPEVSESVTKYAGEPFSVTFTMDKAENIEQTVRLFTAAGASVERTANELKVNGDLGAFLMNILADSDFMYKNEGGTVSSKYGLNEKEVMKTWWHSLGKIEKVMKKNRQIEESNVIGNVKSKAVEPAYNFYGIETQRVADYAGMLSGMLIFYVIYTMWWGYAIFYLFEGIGLSMKKAKVKKEV